MAGSEFPSKGSGNRFLTQQVLSRSFDSLQEQINTKSVVPSARKHAQLYNLVNTGKTLLTLDLLIDSRCQYITLNDGTLIYTS